MNAKTNPSGRPTAAPAAPAARSTQDPHLTPEQLATRLGVSPLTLERWRKQGVGPVYLRLPGRIRYREEDVLAYENKIRRIGTDKSAVSGEQQ